MVLIRFISIAVFLIVILLGAHYAGVVHFEFLESKPASSAWETQPAPDIAFSTLKGQTISTRSFAGKIVVLNFWASWCLPCREEFPHLLAIARSFPNQMVVIGISTDRSRSDMEAFLNQFRDWQTLANIHWVLDDGSISKSYGIVKVPETIIIDRNHRMVRKIVGTEDWTSGKAAQEIQKRVQAK